MHYAENACHLEGFDCTQPQPSLMAQLAATTFGMGSVPFFIIQAVTACVLLLAANTAFNGFPLLGAVLARDGYAPKALNTRGDRLVFSNGMLALGVAACAILIVFNASLTALIQLYIIGVFVSFTMGQIGMVRHWTHVLRGPLSARERAATVRSMSINLVGAIMTSTVLVIVTITKFTHGAWMVFLAIPVLTALMVGVNRYYRDVEAEITLDDTSHFGASGDVAIVLVNRLQKPVMKAVDYAVAAHHRTTFALHVAADAEAAEALEAEWQRRKVPLKLVIIQSPYREYAAPIARFIHEYRQKFGSSVVTVYLPQYIVGHWWESFLHNRRARRVAGQLMLVHGVTITIVPWLLDSSDLVYGRRSRAVPGQDRAGMPTPAGRAPAPRAPASIRRDYGDGTATH